MGTSCIALPLHNTDWFAIGDAKGKLYGFRFGIKPGSDRIQMLDTGRLRENHHTENVPIRTLLAVYGSGPYVHHKAIQSKGLSYGLFLNNVPAESDGFYSMGDDGKLICWELTKGGWKPGKEVNFRNMPCPVAHGAQPDPARDSCQFIAGHSSRLVPNILVTADQDRKFFVCYDRTKPDELPADGTCSYAAPVRGRAVGGG